MDIKINLLPEELRPRPLIATKTLLLILLIVALVGGGVALGLAKNNADSDRASSEDRIAAIDKEISAIQSDAEAVALTKSVSNLKAMKKAYNAFIASRIGWGDALGSVNARRSSGVTITTLTQTGDSLEVKGTAPGYSAVTSYGRVLDSYEGFVLTGVPSLKGSTFSLTLKVAPGGGR